MLPQKFNSTVLIILAVLSTANCAHAIYDPSEGRWLSRDPIGEAGGLNLYAYAANNPISYNDPLGLDVWVGSRGIHQDINVGNPNGSYSSYTFGTDTRLAVFNPFNNAGSAYEDDPPTSISSSMYLVTTDAEDKIALDYLKLLLKTYQNKPYRFWGSTCRDFSQDMFSFFKDDLRLGKLGAPPAPPRPRPVAAPAPPAAAGTPRR